MLEHLELEFKVHDKARSASNNTVLSDRVTNRSGKANPH